MFENYESNNKKTTGALLVSVSGIDFKDVYILLATKRLDMLSIYDVPLLSLLFLFCVFEVFSFKESNQEGMGFTLCTH